MSTDLYHKAIVDLARSGERYPRLDAPDATVTLDNPLCGDRVTLDLVMNEGTVQQVGQRIRGCLLCEAAGALIASVSPGQAPAGLSGMRAKVAEVLGAENRDRASERIAALGEIWAELEVFIPVREYKSRHECVLLPFEAFANVLDEAVKAG